MKNQELLDFSSYCVSNYSRFDKSTEKYNISINDLPDFILHEFSSLIMKSDTSYANEATGPDNNFFSEKMIPALLRFLSNTTDRDEEIEFINEWRDGVSSYFKPLIEEMLEDALHGYNYYQGLTYQDDFSVKRDSIVEYRPW